MDDDHFAAIYVDAYYSNIVIYERENGQPSDNTIKIDMGEGFDYDAPHLIRAEREGNCFRYYVDGELIAERTMNLAPSSVALITEDAQARFDRVSRTLDGVGENLTWKQYDVGVNINGKTVYSTKVTEGVWARPEQRLVFVLY